MANGDYGKGSFLIANPVLPDPNFSRTVILLCNHNEEGSFGLVVNRKSDLRAAEIFVDADLLKNAGYDHEVYIGGPVSPQQVFYLCRYPEPLADLETVCPEVQMGMSWESLDEVLRHLENPSQDLRFYMGYSGWGADQLAGEMEQRSWLTRSAEKDNVFGNPDTRIWADVVRSMGEEYEYLLNAPVDPRNN